MFKAEFRLISPLRVHCLVQPGVEFRETQANHAFWERVATAVGAQHMRQDPNQHGLQYQSTSSIDLPNDIAVLKQQLSMPRDAVCSTERGIEVTGVEWSLCDFGILLVETSLTVTISDQTAHDIERDVQAAATEVNDRIVADSYGTLCAAIKESPNYEDFVVFDNGEPIVHAWASRALIFDPAIEAGASHQRQFAIDWLSNTRHSDEIVERLTTREITHSADWMNYVYLKETADNASEVKENWKALLRAQFYYSAMGRIDGNLTEILSWSMSPSEDISTSKLRQQLRQEMDFAEALFLKKSEVGKYVNPGSRVETERILEVWDFDDVLADPVQMKLQICQTRLDTIESERARSAGFFTDLILMVIGVTSILGTALAVVSLGRSASADPNQTVYDLGAGKLTTWIATQPMDVILLISTIVSVLMVIAFVAARKKSEQ